MADRNPVFEDMPEDKFEVRLDSELTEYLAIVIQTWKAMDIESVRAKSAFSG